MRRIRDRISCSLVFKCVVLAVLVGGAGFDNLVWGETRGVLEVVDQSYDFGQVRQGTIVKHDFALKNTGNADLAIQRVVAACGCTATTTSANVITPGNSVTVSAQFDTNGFAGKREKLIRVYTSDLDKPMETLTLSGEIVADYTLIPSNLMFEPLEPLSSETSRSKEFSLSIRADSGLSFLSSESFSKYLTISELPAGVAARNFKVMIAADAPPGDLRSRVVIHLKDAAGKESAAVLPVFATVKKNIRFEPATISFGLIAPGKVIERVVKLENKSAQPLRVLAIKSNNAAISTELVEKSAGKEFALKITLDPAKLESELSTSIDLTTDSPEQPTLSLTLLGFKAQAATEPNS